MLLKHSFVKLTNSPMLIFLWCIFEKLNPVLWKCICINACMQDHACAMTLLWFLSWSHLQPFPLANNEEALVTATSLWRWNPFKWPLLILTTTLWKVCMNGGHPSSLLDPNSCGMVFTVSGQLVPLACKTSGCALTAFSQPFPDWQSGCHACDAAVLEMKKLLWGCQPVWRLCNKRLPGSAVGFLERRSCVVLAVVSEERLSGACGCHGLNEA